MLKHNLKLFIRNIKKYKSTFLINIIGLSTGLACVLLIALWVQDELSIDKFHANNDNLYQVIEYAETDGTIITNPVTSIAVVETLAEEFPEVKYGVNVNTWGANETMLSVNKTEIKAAGLYVGEDYFKVFSYPLLDGDEQSLLNDKNAIVISEALANKFFGTVNNVVGKVIELRHENPLVVSGVFKSVPANSSMHFDFALSFEQYKETFSEDVYWTHNVTNSYIVLNDDVNVEAFNDKIASLIKVKTKDQSRTLSTRLFSDVYLYGTYENGKQVGGRISYVKLFSLIAFLILLIACINFMNLSTANASRRLKEIGVKKAMGAKRKVMVFQHLSESLVMTFLSLLSAIILVLVLLPQFNEITGKQLIFDLSINQIFLAAIVLISTGLIAGSYPAFYLSGLNSVIALKGKLSNSSSEIWARKGLVITQFTLSVILIVSVLVIYKQISFLQTKNLGYEKDNMIYFEIEGKVSENLDAFLSELSQVEGIEQASSIGQSIMGGMNTLNNLEWPGKVSDEKIVFQMRAVNYEMLETLNIKMAAGRTFAKNFGAEESKIIFNQAAIDIMGMKDPIGKEISIQNSQLKIIGVTEDFHFTSLHEKIKPMFFILRPSWTHLIMAKIEPSMETVALGNLHDFYDRFNPDISLDYKFLDDAYQSQYVAEQRVATLSKYFAGLAIIISCLGLFGLATFTAERRRKEIGIRKVLGHSNEQIAVLLSSEFAKLVLIGIVIALPISYLLTNDWLSNFAYKINLQLWYFIAAGAAALMVALLTVSTQAIRAAYKNPVEALRQE